MTGSWTRLRLMLCNCNDGRLGQEEIQSRWRFPALRRLLRVKRFYRTKRHVNWLFERLIMIITDRITGKHRSDVGGQAAVAVIIIFGVTNSNFVGQTKLCAYWNCLCVESFRSPLLLCGRLFCSASSFLGRYQEFSLMFVQFFPMLVGTTQLTLQSPLTGGGGGGGGEGDVEETTTRVYAHFSWIFFCGCAVAVEMLANAFQRTEPRVVVTINNYADGSGLLVPRNASQVGKWIGYRESFQAKIAFVAFAENIGE